MNQQIFVSLHLQLLISLLMKKYVIRLKSCLLAAFGSRLKKLDLWKPVMYGPLEMEY